MQGVQPYQPIVPSQTPIMKINLEHNATKQVARKETYLCQTPKAKFSYLLMPHKPLKQPSWRLNMLKLPKLAPKTP